MAQTVKADRKTMGMKEGELGSKKTGRKAGLGPRFQMSHYSIIHHNKSGLQEATRRVKSVKATSYQHQLFNEDLEEEEKASGLIGL